jgi:BMFP domain-containing protein YqiC
MSSVIATTLRTLFPCRADPVGVCPSTRVAFERPQFEPSVALAPPRAHHNVLRSCPVSSSSFPAVVVVVFAIREGDSLEQLEQRIHEVEHEAIVHAVRKVVDLCRTGEWWLYEPGWVLPSVALAPPRAHHNVLRSCPVSSSSFPVVREVPIREGDSLEQLEQRIHEVEHEAIVHAVRTRWIMSPVEVIFPAR